MKLTATCGKCGNDQLLIPDAGDKDQMVRCPKCKTDVGDKAAVTKKLREAGEKEAKKIVDDLKKTLRKAGFK